MSIRIIQLSSLITIFITTAVQVVKAQISTSEIVVENTNLTKVTGEVRIEDTQDGLATPLKIFNNQGSGYIKTSVGIDFHHFNVPGHPNARIYEIEDGSSGTFGGQLRFATRTHGGSAGSTTLNDRLVIDRLGRVGIGTVSPSTQLYVVGSTWSTTGWSSSDIRWKRNINSITNAMHILNGINPVSYYWRNQEFPDQNFDSRKHYGVIAQEIQEILPDLVNFNEEGFQSVDYTSLIAILIKAVQEKDQELASLRDDFQRLESKVLENAQIIRQQKEIEEVKLKSKD